MKIYLALEFVHVMAAIAWVGGGLCVSVFGTILESRRDSRSLLALIRLLGTHGHTFFMPAALLTLVSGIGLFSIGAMTWSAWSILAILLLGTAFGVCSNIMKTAADRVVYLMDVGRDAQALTEARGLLRQSRFECATMAAIVALMVMKPDWNDLVVLAGIGALLAVAAIAFLVRLRPAVL